MTPSKGSPAKKSPAKKSASKSASAGRSGKASQSNDGRNELIVVAQADARLRVRSGRVESIGGAEHRSLNAILANDSVAMRPLFGPEERVIRQAQLALKHAISPVPDLSVFYGVTASNGQFGDFAEQFNAVDEISGAYVKPAAEPPVRTTAPPSPDEAPAVTPNYVARQGYLGPAPGGIDARYASTWPAGGGNEVRIVDVEWGWKLSHEDLLQVQGGVVVGTASTAQSKVDHGTAVIGVLGGDRNAFGITGICPEALVMTASVEGSSTATTIRDAVNRLRPGDFMLLEIHRAGPRNNYAARPDQLGYIAIEWWPDDFAVISFATSQGIIVVEPAGNGAEDLDDALYDTAGTGFPTDWTNPFDRNNRDSGAIVVGAGAPPPGTHGQNWGADRSRLSFSNYGALIDAQGWGQEITTTGYGDLQGGTDQDFWYADSFNGTSGASPVVTGALVCLQGVLRTKHQLMMPSDARSWLRATGSAQQDEPGRPATQRIGNRPDLKVLLDRYTKPHKETKEKEFKEADKNKESFDKSYKEFDGGKFSKDFKEPKEFAEGGKTFSDSTKLADGGLGGLETRLSQVESTVAALGHFISRDLRPDLTYSALSREPDLQAEADAAKSYKDVKDKEHLAER